MEFTVRCDVKDAKAKNKALRRAGQIPAVLYGHDGTNTLSLTIAQGAAANLVKAASLNNSLINVEIPSESLEFRTLLRDVQIDPVSGNLLHLSFFAVTAKSQLHATVPVRLVGVSESVEMRGAIIDLRLSELEVSCIPSKIPEAIEVDITPMDVGHHIHVKDLKLPAGVEMMGSPERLLLSVHMPGVTPSLDEAVEADPPLVEVAMADSTTT